MDALGAILHEVPDVAFVVLDKTLRVLEWNIGMAWVTGLPSRVGCDFRTLACDPKSLELFTTLALRGVSNYNRIHFRNNKVLAMTFLRTTDGKGVYCIARGVCILQTLERGRTPMVLVVNGKVAMWNDAMKKATLTQGANLVGLRLVDALRLAVAVDPEQTAATLLTTGFGVLRFYSSNREAHELGMLCSSIDGVCCLMAHEPAHPSYILGKWCTITSPAEVLRARHPTTHSTSPDWLSQSILTDDYADGNVSGSDAEVATI
jgi:hypothetical protein